RSCGGDAAEQPDPASGIPRGGEPAGRESALPARVGGALPAGADRRTAARGWDRGGPERPDALAGGCAFGWAAGGRADPRTGAPWGRGRDVGACGCVAV